MSVSNRHILQQGPVLKGLLRTIAAAAAQQVSGQKAEAPAVPSRILREKTPPRPSDLLDDYIEHVGGNKAAYAGTVPPHFFPQWAFGLAGETLKGIPYPMAKVMNGGCRIEVNGKLPRGEAFDTTAQLVRIDDNGRRAVLEQRIETGPASQPNALVARMFPIVPLKSGDKSKKDEKPVVPDGAREIAKLRLGKNAGLDFAKLTGDFNPIHWVNPYAKAFGFRGVILHGFGTMARAIEALVASELGGDPTRLRVFDCQFTKPLHLPREVSVFVTKDKQLFVGDRVGGDFYLRASYESGDPR
jgi:hypothetical protein